MKKVNQYLIKLSIKYIIYTLAILSIFILFLNLIEISRILANEDSSVYTYALLSFLKYPSILNEILPFVVIIGISFLFSNLVKNNELISLRNIGYSIFDIFVPIGFTVFLIGIFFLIFLNPISSNFEEKYQNLINEKNKSLHSIKILNNEMWIKNKIDDNNSSFISIENIDLQSMKAKNIKILLINQNSNIFIRANNGFFGDNNISLEQVTYYNVNKENFKTLDKFDLKINFNKQNILNAIINYKYIPFYNYINHSRTLMKFNLYSPEIGLFYISELLKPFFIVMLTFLVISFSGKFRRNENFFKVLFISILIGFIIFFLKEIVNKLTLSLSINFFISYLVIFMLPLSVGLYQVIKIEND